MTIWRDRDRFGSVLPKYYRIPKDDKSKVECSFWTANDIGVPSQKEIKKLLINI